jgi:hypothetical protein
VIRDCLLVGAYPASEEDEETFELISSILINRINTFVCLQSEVGNNYLQHLFTFYTLSLEESCFSCELLFLTTDLPS